MYFKRIFFCVYKFKWRKMVISRRARVVVVGWFCNRWIEFYHWLLIVGSVWMLKSDRSVHARSARTRGPFLVCKYKDKTCINWFALNYPFLTNINHQWNALLLFKPKMIKSGTRNIYCTSKAKNVGMVISKKIVFSWTEFVNLFVSLQEASICFFSCLAHLVS